MFELQTLRISFKKSYIINVKLRIENKFRFKMFSNKTFFYYYYSCHEKYYMNKVMINNIKRITDLYSVSRSILTS